MANKDPLLKLLEELCSMSLDELIAVRPEFLAQTEGLSEKAREACTKAIDLVIEHKWERLRKQLVEQLQAAT